MFRFSGNRRSIWHQKGWVGINENKVEIWLNKKRKNDVAPSCQFINTTHSDSKQAAVLHMCIQPSFPVLRSASRPRYDVVPSLQPITANFRLMLKGKLLVRAADFFPHSHWHFNSTKDPNVDRFEIGTYNFPSLWSGGEIRGGKTRLFAHRIPVRHRCWLSAGEFGQTVPSFIYF